MKSSFSDMGISPPILKAIDEMGFKEPTEVQSTAIPHILNKDDVIVMSKTGSGKTAVFGISMLQMTDPDAEGPQGLIITPTRELAVQVNNDIRQMSKHLKHRTTAVYGQHSIHVEIQALKKGQTIVTGTPGRIYDHIQHNNLNTKHIRFLVLDEVDRMMDMGFIDQVMKIVRAVPKNRITLLFSATIPSEVQRICRDYMRNPVTIEIESKTKTVDSIEQMYYRVKRNEKRTQLNRLLLMEQPDNCMIFCNTRVAVDMVQSFLTSKGYACQALHGDIPQGRRIKNIDQFKRGDFHILVATDVAARGIHIEGLSLVINYDVPLEKDSYVHRIGRTGRIGHNGRAITLVTDDDIMSLYEIEEHIGAMIPEADLPSDNDLAENKEGSQKWIEANKLMPKPAQASSNQKSKGTQRKPYNKGTHSQDKSYSGSRQNQSNSDGKDSNNRLTQNNYNRKPDSRPDNAGRSDKPYNRPDQAGRSDKPYNKPAQASSNRKPYNTPTQAASAGQQRQNYRNEQNTKAEQKLGGNQQYNLNSTVTTEPKHDNQTTKKPFLKRLMDKLLGK